MNLLVIFVLCVSMAVVAAETELNCRERNRLIRINRRDEYKIVDAKLGDKLILECHYCHEKDDEAPKIWYKKANPINSTIEEVELGMASNLTTNRVYVTSEHSLVIQNISRNDTGIYFCHGIEGIGKEFKFNYLIDIILSTRHLPQVGNLSIWADYQTQWLFPAKRILHSSPISAKIGEFNIRLDVYSDWEEWGPCVSCRRSVGERRRVGKCRLKAKQPQHEVNKTESSEFPSYIKILMASSLSCHSQMVHDIGETEFGIALWVIPDFIQTEVCKGKCVKKTDQTIGFFKAQPGIKPKAHYKFPVKTHRSIMCPGATPASVVTWEKGKDKLGLDKHEKPLLTDSYGTLLFKSPTKMEGGNYTCYIDDVKVQEVWIIFYSSWDLISPETLRFYMYLAFILCLCFVCYCGGVVKACCERSSFTTYYDV